MNKKGISPLIAIILSIGVVVVIASLIVVWSRDIFNTTMKSPEEDKEAEMVCETKVEFSIEDTIPIDEGTEITITNAANTQIENFVAKVYLDNGEVRLIQGIEAVDTLEGHDTKSYTISYEGVATKIELVPKIKLKEGKTTICKKKIEETIVS
jgi:FlaG/FlaF family flagellin (archaellin)